MQELPPSSRWVAVTGAGSGIGAGIVSRLRAAGYGVLGIDIDPAALGRFAGDPGLRTLTADIAEPSSALALREAAEATGGMWGLVNCAGVAALGHFLLSPEEEWQRVLRVNVEGTLRATQAIGGVITERGGGAIVNISSISGINPAALQAPYAASKAAIIGFTTSLAFDLGPMDVTVNAISPGVVRTPIWDGLLRSEAAARGLGEDEVFAQHVRPIPLGRPQAPEDIGDAVVFLVGPAARSISGATLRITGGQTTVVFDHEEGAEAYRDAQRGPSGRGKDRSAGTTVA